MKSESSVANLDPITFEVLSNAFTSIVEDMGVMLEKVSFSTVTTIGKDYACVLADANGDVFARGRGGLPLLTGTVPHRLRGILQEVGVDDLAEGDVILQNDPYLGGTHCQDTSASMPIFLDGNLVAFATACSHWPDLGGPVPGSFNSEATDTYNEAIVIPPIHIMREGEWVRDAERFILRNVRIPEIIQGDLRGLIEACRTGREEYLHLVEKYGYETIAQQAVAQMDHSERLLRDQISKLPDGTYSFTDYIDRDPGAESDDPVEVSVDLVIDGDQLIVDLSRSAPQAIGPVNACLAATEASIATAVKEIFYEIPWNEGFQRVIDVRVPEGTVLSAQYPAPVSGVAASPAEKLISVMHGAFIQVVPERSMACPTNLVNVSVFGQDTRHGGNDDYVLYIWLAGGWGGRPATRDACTTMMPLGPATNLQPAESLERIYPVMFDGFEYRPDSEGAGLHRGGFAFTCPFHVVGTEASVNVQGDRQAIVGWGYDGGLPAPGNGLIYAPGTSDERQFEIMSAGNIVLPDVEIDYWQGGGGGWGDPQKRPPEWVLEDVQADLISPERAREVYGVVIVEADDPVDHAIDQAATDTLRAS